MQVLLVRSKSQIQADLSNEIFNSKKFILNYLYIYLTLKGVSHGIHGRKWIKIQQCNVKADKILEKNLREKLSHSITIQKVNISVLQYLMIKFHGNIGWFKYIFHKYKLVLLVCIISSEPNSNSS